MAGARRLLEVGRVMRPHGLDGEVVVDLVTNRLERLAPGTVLVGAGPGRGPRQAPGDHRQPEVSLRVEASRPFQHRHLVRFENVKGREQAAALRGLVLLAEPIEDPDALFVHELIGCEVVDATGLSHGRVAAVQENPASDLLVGEEGWLVPLRFVVERSAGRVVVDVPEGMFD